MKKIKSKLISAAITSLLAASWYFEIYNLAVFSSVIFWISVLISFACSIVLSYYIGQFDNGDFSKEQAIKTFKGFSNKNKFDFAFSGFMSTMNVSLLILINSPVLAAFYLLSALCIIKLSKSCIARYSKAVEMD